MGAKHILKTWVSAVLLFTALAGAPPLRAQQPTAVDQLLDRIVDGEKKFLETMRKHSPLVETYIQELTETAPDDLRPSRDHYFLGRVSLTDDINYEPLVARTDTPKTSRLWFLKSKPLTFLPKGFAQMTVMDVKDFDRKTYEFEFVRREFLGDVRCLVFDVLPRVKDTPGKFFGRIWAEDRDYRVVRFNGTYTRPKGKRNPNDERYFHFDSWRVSVAPGLWVPAQIYVEEEGSTDRSTSGGGVTFKAQTRIWGYRAGVNNRMDELTNILVEQDAPVVDRAGSTNITPLESQRSWEHQAEENIVQRLETGGFLAPPGPVDEVLNTVVNNLIVSNNLNVQAHCRVLLTTPLETFSIGQTIVISRGLLDVLPDETSLAMVLASELSHIALGHRTETQFAFYNRTMLSDEETLEQFRFQRSAQQMAEAATKTVEIMKNSPYKKLGNAGLFLKALSVHGATLTRLIHANLGNQLASGDNLARFTEFINQAPPLDENKLEQIAALPLGSRIKLNPWNDQIVLLPNKPVSLLSPREKMPFEVTPFVLYLTRIDGPDTKEHVASRH